MPDIVECDFITSFIISSVQPDVEAVSWHIIHSPPAGSSAAPTVLEAAKWKCSLNISTPQVTPPSSPRSPAKYFTGDELTLTESDSESDYLKLQAENIKEKFFRELAIPDAAAANKKPGAKRPRKTTITTVPRKSARIAASS